MVNWWKLAEAILDTEVPDWDLLLQVADFHAPRDLGTNFLSHQQVRTHSTTIGLDWDQWSANMKPWLPLRTSSRTKLQMIRIVQLTLGGKRSHSRRDTTRANNNPSPNLQQIMPRFVAYVASSSAVEQTFSQCRSQFGHLRNLSALVILRVLVLASTKSQSQEVDESLYARARLIWAENFAAPILPKP